MTINYNHDKYRPSYHVDIKFFFLFILPRDGKSCLPIKKKLTKPKRKMKPFHSKATVTKVLVPLSSFSHCDFRIKDKRTFSRFNLRQITSKRNLNGKKHNGPIFIRRKNEKCNRTSVQQGEH